MVSSAQLEILPLEEAAIPIEHVRGSDLQQQTAERVAAFRARRTHSAAAPPVPRAEPRLVKKDKIAAAVAARYAQTPSYRAFLAAEAQRAIEQAAAAAQVAQRNAAAVAAAQQELLAELDLWTAPQTFTVATQLERPTAKDAGGTDAGPGSTRELPARSRVVSGGLTVRLYEQAGRTLPTHSASGEDVPKGSQPSAYERGLPNAEESRALDAEIAFRQAPVFDLFPIEGEPSPTESIPANLLEFPRHLVASKKVRPRLAEGPLREDAPRSPQLRIFEVEAEQISTSALTPSVVPEWTSIRLDAHTPTDAVRDGATPFMLGSLPAPEVATLKRRLAAALIDGVIIFAGLAAFGGVFAKLVSKVPLDLAFGVAVAGVLFLLWLAYELLFFTLNEATPGMRFSRLGLCTFGDENPSRRAMRRRILAQMVAALPLGLGFLWVLLDDDHLGWHDRISRMYQRAY